MKMKSAVLLFALLSVSALSGQTDNRLLLVNGVVNVDVQGEDAFVDPDPSEIHSGKYTRLVQFISYPDADMRAGLKTQGAEFYQ